MENAKNSSDFECYTPLSEPFRFYPDSKYLMLITEAVIWNIIDLCVTLSLTCRHFENKEFRKIIAVKKICRVEVHELLLSLSLIACLCIG
jgi:hypothetical protein